MAIIDLSRFSPGIRQDNRQRQAFGEDDGGIYEAASKVSSAFLNVAIQNSEKEKQLKLENFKSDSVNKLLEANAEHEESWKKLSEAGVMEDDNKLSYVNSKTKYIADKTKEIEDSSDPEMFAQIKPTLDALKSKSYIGALSNSSKFLKTALNFNFTKLIETTQNDIVNLDASAIADYYNNQFKNKLTGEVEKGKKIDPNLTNEYSNKALKEVSKVYFEKLISNDFKMYTIQQALNDTVPIDTFITNSGKMMFKLLDGKSGDLEQNKIIAQTKIDVSRQFFLEARKNILVRQQSKNSKLSAEDADKAIQKIDKFLETIASKEKQLEESNIPTEVPLKGTRVRYDNTGTGKQESYDLSKWSNLIDATSKTFDIDKNLIRALMAQETKGINTTGAVDVYKEGPQKGQPKVIAGEVSKGYGLMQMTPIAIKDVNDTYGTNYTAQDMADPAKNLEAFGKFMSLLKKRHGNDTETLIKIYNAGPGAKESKDAQTYYASVKGDLEKVNNLKLTAEEIGLDNNTFNPNEIAEMNSLTNANKAYDLYNYADPSDKIRLFKTILSTSVDSASFSKSDTLAIMNEKVAKAFVMGSTQESSNDIFNLYLKNKGEFKNSKMDVINKMFEAQVAEVMYENLQDKAKFADDDGRFFEEVRRTAVNKMIEQFKESAPELYDTVALAGGDIGITVQKDVIQRAVNTRRDIQVMMAQSPEKAMILFGNNTLNGLARSAFNKDGSINEDALKRLDTAFTTSFAEYMNPWNMDSSSKLLDGIAAKYFNSMKNYLQYNNPENMGFAIKKLSELSPEFGSKLIGSMLSNGNITQEIANSLRTSFVIKNIPNKNLANRLLTDSMGANLKQINQWKSDASNKEDLKTIKEQVATNLSNFYKYSSDPLTRQALVSNITNHVVAMRLGDSNLDIAEYSKKIITELTSNKFNFNTNEIKGTIIKNPTEKNQDNIEAKIKTKFDSIQSQIINGNIQLDYSKLPKLSGVASQKDANIVREYITKKGNMSAETLDDSGNGRTFYMMMRDKSGGKVLVRDIKGNPIKFSID